MPTRIFDEASQIPLEEAIPAIYRSHQVIIVGDEMQLPPTTFFAATRTGDESVIVEEDGERFEVDLDSDSFLTQSAQNLGIVAFSEAQQTEIENAFSRLGDEDGAFAAQLEAEYVREENDVFCGLFVKNLENVRGDERDIIFMSVCYGHDAM